MLARHSPEFTKKEALFEKSFSLYHRALALNPNDSEVLYSFGNACFRRSLSQHERGEISSTTTLLQSCEMYATALDCSPSFKDSFVNLGVAIALAVKWRLPLFASGDLSWGRCIQLFLGSTEAFAGNRAFVSTLRRPFSPRLLLLLP
jgi:hypothetical protein